MSEAISLLAALMRLWDATYDRIRVFPKLDKHLLGRAILDDLDACILHVLLALNDGVRRHDHLVSVSATFDRCKLKLRIAVKREVISERWYASQLNDLAAIGRMIGGWRRAQSRERERE